MKTFLYAVKNHYWYQMYLDDLPIWGIVGEIDEKGEDFYIWTHKKFEIGWNGDQIVDVASLAETDTFEICQAGYADRKLIYDSRLE